MNLYEFPHWSSDAIALVLSRFGELEVTRNAPGIEGYVHPHGYVSVEVSAGEATLLIDAWARRVENYCLEIVRNAQENSMSLVWTVLADTTLIEVQPQLVSVRAGESSRSSEAAAVIGSIGNEKYLVEYSSEAGLREWVAEEQRLREMSPEELLASGDAMLLSEESPHFRTFP